MEDSRQSAATPLKQSEDEGFKGQFTNIKLSDLIQMSAQGRMNLILNVTQNQKTGRIYIEEGEIIHAVHGEQTGIEAFYEIMSWKKGDFQAEGYSPPPTRSITLPWEHLLIEAHRWMDEQKDATLDGKEEAAARVEEKLTPVLQYWGESHPDISEIGILTADDFTTLYQRDDSPVSRKGIEILRTNMRLSEILSHTLKCGDCQETLITGDEGAMAVFFLIPNIQVYIRIGVNILQKALLVLEIKELMQDLGEQLQEEIEALYPSSPPPEEGE